MKNEKKVLRILYFICLSGVFVFGLMTIIACNGGGGSGGGDDTGGTVAEDFALTSQNFTNGGTIPLLHACTFLGGDNQSPQLTWSDPPPNTNSYALIVDDEDAPCGTGDNACKHWSVYNIPATTTSFEVNQNVTTINGITEGQNYTGSNGYEGPCPPNQHTYNFTIYALDDGMPTIDSGTGLTRSQFQTTYNVESRTGAVA